MKFINLNLLFLKEIYGTQAQQTQGTLWRLTEVTDKNQYYFGQEVHGGYLVAQPEYLLRSIR